MRKKNIFRKLSSMLIATAVAAVTLFPVNAFAGSNPRMNLWSDTAYSANALVNYMDSITNPASADYIPESRRIAVFDMDGTLLNETAPTYFDTILFCRRVFLDPTFTPTKKQKDTAIRVMNIIDGKDKSDLTEVLAPVMDSVYSGMTLAQYKQYVLEFMNTPVEGYTGLLKGNAFYKPMLQLIEYLQANGFKVYVVSGTDRIEARLLISGKINIPADQVIGSDYTLVATDQGSTDGLKYTYTPEDDLVIGGDLIVKNLKMNKVTAIEREIGVKPVLSFGNSSGDAAMANYVTSNNQYKSMAFMLLCDDVVRENGNLSKAESMRESCVKNGWVPVSMRDDFLTIYGDGVTRIIN